MNAEPASDGATTDVLSSSPEVPTAQESPQGDGAAVGQQTSSHAEIAGSDTASHSKIDLTGEHSAANVSTQSAPAAAEPAEQPATSASPRLPLPPRLNFEPVPVRPPAQNAGDDDDTGSPTGSGAPGSPRRRSSIVVAFAKGVGNRLGLRNKGAPDDTQDEQVQADGAVTSAPTAAAEEDDSPRRRRPSVTAREAAGDAAAASAQPSTAPSAAANGDALHIDGASFVSDAQGGDFQSSPKAAAQRLPHSAPRQGSLQDLSAPSEHPGIQRSNTMPHPGRRRSILKKPSSPPSATRGRRISFADDSARPLEDVKYCDNLHYSEGSQHAGDEDEKCVIM